MLTYAVGDDNLLVVPGAMAFVPDPIAAPVALGMWNAMARGDGFSAVLESLVSVYGTSMGSLPSFAVVSWDAASQEGRVVVRGPLSVTVTHVDGTEEQVSALGVTTWTERLIPGLAAVRVGAVGVDTPYGVRDGIVRAGGARWTLAGRDHEPSSVPGDSLDAVPAPLPGFDPVPDPSRAPDPVPDAAPTPVPSPDPIPDPVSRPELTPALELEPAPSPDPEPAPSAVDTAEDRPDLAAQETRYPSPEEPVDQTYADDPRTFLGAVPTSEAGLSDETTTYDDLIFGETRIGTVEEAAVRVSDPGEAPPQAPTGGMIGAVPSGGASSAPVPPAAAPAGAAEILGDHDGETVSAAHLEAIQHLIGAPAGTPPTAAQAAATLVLPTGERVLLDRHAVVGRRPRAVRATGALPHLVTVASPHQDVSRSHVELRVEGASVVAIDLDTTNGTRLLRVGADPVRLQPGEAALLVAGDQLDISDGVVLAFEGL